MPAASSDNLSYDPSWVKRREQKRAAPASEIVADLIRRRAENSSDIFRLRGCVGDWRPMGSVFEQVIRRLARNYAGGSARTENSRRNDRDAD